MLGGHQMKVFRIMIKWMYAVRSTNQKMVVAFFTELMCVVRSPSGYIAQSAGAVEYTNCISEQA